MGGIARSSSDPVIKGIRAPKGLTTIARKLVIQNTFASGRPLCVQLIQLSDSDMVTKAPFCNLVLYLPAYAAIFFSSHDNGNGFL